MTGHYAGHHPRSAVPAADHRLDQFAAAVAEARATNPAIAALAATEDQFIEAAMDIGAHLDHQTVGAAWLILGQLFGTNLASVAPEQQAGALAMLLNVAKLAGQRLYTGDRLPVEVPCPFTYTTGAPCKTVVKAPNRERADVLLAAHAWQQHPGQEQAPSVAAEETAYCACGNPAQLIVGITNHPDGEGGTAKAQCTDCHRREQVGAMARWVAEQSASGRCPDCGHWIYLADGRIGFHLSGPHGNQHTCAGAGKTPLDGADGEAQG